MDNLVSELHFASQRENDFKKIYLKEIYNIDKKENQSLQEEFLWERKERWYIKEGCSYVSWEPDILDVKLGVGFWLIHKKLKIEGNIRYDISYKEIDSSKTKPTEKEIVIWKDMHCWEGKISWKKRVGEEEIWLMLNLKAFPERKVGIHHNVQQREWDFRTKRD